MFSFFSNDDDGDDDIADYENKRGDGGVLHKWIYPQVRAPLLITHKCSPFTQAWR